MRDFISFRGKRRVQMDRAMYRTVHARNTPHGGANYCDLRMPSITCIHLTPVFPSVWRRVALCGKLSLFEFPFLPALEVSDEDDW